MRYLLVDDCLLVRKGMAHLLYQVKNCETKVDEAASAAQALELMSLYRHDLVVLELSLPDAKGFEGLELLKRKCPDVPVLIFSMHEESHFAELALKAGAAGYLHKRCAESEIIDAVNKVLKDGHYLSVAYAQRIALAGIRGEKQARWQGLTAHELQVLCLIGAGNTVGQIATTVCRSVKTISSHRANILQKMDMRTNAELIHYCMNTGLVRWNTGRRLVGWPSGLAASPASFQQQPHQPHQPKPGEAHCMAASATASPVCANSV